MTSESGDNSPPTSRRGRNIIFLPPSAPRSEKSVNNRRKRRVHCNSAKRLRCTTFFFRRAPWYDQRHKSNRAGNVNTRLRAGRTDTSQCNPYQLKLRGNGTVGIYDCNHEHHTGATENTCLSTKQPSEAKNKVLLLELQEQFYSREKTWSAKKAGHQEEAYYKKGMGVSEKGCE